MASTSSLAPSGSSSAASFVTAPNDERQDDEESAEPPVGTSSPPTGGAGNNDDDDDEGTEGSEEPQRGGGGADTGQHHPVYIGTIDATDRRSAVAAAAASDSEDDEEENEGASDGPTTTTTDPAASATAEAEMTATATTTIAEEETTVQQQRALTTATPEIDMVVDDDVEAEQRRNLVNNEDSGSDDDNMQSGGGRCCRRCFSSVCCCCCTACRSDSFWRNRLRGSLSWAPTTPILATLSIPAVAAAAHAIFYYGQTAPMWKLTYAVDVDVWANASSLEARSTFYTLGLDRDLHLAANEQSTVREFTYGFAITELWAAAGMPGKFLPRVAAVLLVLFSGVWPHLKLFLLSLTWLFIPWRHGKHCGRILHWLSTFGKWSIADVLVVCLMMAILHMDWDVDPTLIKQGLIEEVPLLLKLLQNLWSPNDICSYLLHYSCVDPPGRFDRTKCQSCKTFVETSMNHPETSRSTFKSIASGVNESGSGLVTLRVAGLDGIYAFCIAVILSIALSLIVDIFHVRAKKRQYRELEAAGANVSEGDALGDLLLLQVGEEVFLGETTGIDAVQLSDSRNNVAASSNVGPTSGTLAEPLLTRTASMDDDGEEELGQALSPQHQPQSEEERRRISRLQRRELMLRQRIYEQQRSLKDGVLGCCYLSVALVVSGLVLIAVYVQSLDRHVTGAGPHLLESVLGIVFDRQFSLVTLGQVLGDAGGWDKLLMGTFALFLIIGPLLRAVLCVLAFLFGQRLPTLLVTVIDHLGAFCAWEVIILSAYLVSLLIPSTTSTILMKPECAVVSPDTGNACLTVYFDPNEYFALIVSGGVLLILISQIPERIVAARRRRRRQRQRIVI